jgi:ABC-type bacteriocin/lantibiotic exporter with double-glycine peptidase domain
MSTKNQNQRAKASSLKYVVRNIIWPRKGLLLLGLVLIIFNRLSGLALPGASKILIDDVIANKDTSLLKLLLIGVSVALIIQSVTSYLLTKLLSVEAQNLIAKLRAQVQRHIIHLPISYFNNTRAGELVSRIMTDVEGVRNLVGTGLVQMVGGVLTAVVSLVILINISAMLTLYVIIPLLIFGLISLKAFKYIRPIFRKRGEINADVTGRLTESLNGIRVIKGFNAENQESDTFADGVDRLFKNVKSSLTTTSLVTSSATLLLGLASVGIMGIGGYMIIKDELTIGDFFAFTLYLGFLIAPIVQMSNIGSQITEAFAGLDRMEEVMALEMENENEQRIVELKKVKGDLAFEAVSFSYEADKPVLHDISFDAAPGTVTALVGSSGSGKTTIASIAASFLTPQQGIVSIDGQDLSKVTLESYRQNLGVVLQDDFLFEGSIRDNILFPRPDAGEHELQNAIKAAYVDEFTDRFDDGLNTLIGRSADGRSADPDPG